MKLSYFFIIFTLFFSSQIVFATTVPVSAAPPPCTVSSLLKIGSKGAEVQCLQKKVGAVADGFFGPLTNAAVVVFQNGHGLVADGVVGPLSRAMLNGIATNSSNYPAGCTSNIGYSTTTGSKCDGSSNEGTSSPLASSASAANNGNNNNSEPLGESVNSTSPNLSNLDLYIAAVKERALKAGFSQDKIQFLEDKIRKEAATNVDFLQQFFDTQKAFYNKKISENTPEAPAFSFIKKAISFIDRAFSPEKASAATGLPFGGFVTYVNPAICDCPPGLITQVFIALPNANPSISNLLLNYVNGSQAFSNYNLPESGIAVLGTYEPGVISCFTYVFASCVPFPYQDGQIIPETGSSLTQ